MSRLLRFILAILLAFIGNAPGVVRADSGDNPHQIPGVPIPGGTVEGVGGGSVYDLVFRIDVPPHRVLVTQLSGDPGTDFDLYLFDNSATDIYSTQGQVGTSTGPTSSEFINHATTRGGTFYVDVASFGRVVGAFTLVTRVLDDTTAPTVSVVLDGGAAQTNDGVVVVTVEANDTISGVADMQFSDDGVTWDDWQPYHNLSFRPYSNDGLKTLFVRVRDRLGNVAAPVSASITVDTSPPTVTNRTPAPLGDAVGARPTFLMTFSEPVTASSWERDGLIVQDAQGDAIPGTRSYDAATMTGRFVPDRDLVFGAVYVVSMGPVVDLAGNSTPLLGTWIVHAIAQAMLELTTPTTTVAAGSVVNLTVTAPGSPAATLILEESIAGAPWAPIFSFPTPPVGAYSVPVTVAKTTLYRVRVASTPTSAEGSSPIVRIVARPSVSFANVSRSVTRVVAAKQSVSLTAAVTPAEAASAVTVTVYRYVASKKQYVVVTTIRRGTVRGRASVTWRPTVAGSYYLRLTTAGDARYGAATSVAYRWRVS